MKVTKVKYSKEGQIILIPKEYELKNATEVSLEKRGKSLIIKPIKKSWLSLLDEAKADSDFLIERQSIIKNR